MGFSCNLKADVLNATSSISRLLSGQTDNYLAVQLIEIA
jgi:hypothetical protein